MDLPMALYVPVLLAGAPPDAGPCYDWCPNTISSCKWKKCTGCPACG